MEDMTTLLDIIESYGRGTGQQINLLKSALVFSPGVPSSIKTDMLQATGVNEVDQHDRYLGLPTTMGRNKTVTWNNLLDKFSGCFKGWKGSSLSVAGKEVVIKAVAQALPTYAMSYFKLPDGICDKMESLTRSFWWSKQDKDKGVCWKAWDQVQLPRAQGGIGFKNLKCFNQALLAKQGWRIVNNPNSLLSRVLKAKYFSNSSFWEASLGYSSSFAWRSILHGRELLQKGVRWCLGDGRSFRLCDPFLPSHPKFKIISNPACEERVCEYITGDRKWDTVKLSEAVWPVDIEAITTMSIPVNSRPDRLIWHFEANGIYRVRSGYKQACAGICASENVSDMNFYSDFWAVLWKLPVPRKIMHLIWRIFHNAIPTADNLLYRNILVNPMCSLCGEKEESVAHLFVECKFAGKVWTGLGWKKEKQKIEGGVARWLVNLFRNEDLPQKGGLCFFFWGVWIARNQKNFEGISQQSGKVVGGIFDAWEEARSVIVEGHDLPFAEAVQKWEVLPEGWMLLSFDGAFDEDGTRSGGGVLLKDRFGKGIAARSIAGPLGHNARGVEAAALREGIRLAIFCEVRNVVIEGDAKDVLEDLEKLRSGLDPKDISESSDTLLECVSLATGLENTVVKWIRRSKNKPAHDIAQHAKYSCNSNQ